MFAILNKPYPFNNDVAANLKFHIAIGFFVSFFLIVFEPFGINNWDTQFKTLKLVGYGVISFIIPTILFFLRNHIVHKYNYDQRYIVAHEIIWSLIILIGVALSNCIYITFLHNISFTYNLFKYGVFMVGAIGLFPVLANVILKHNHFLALNIKEAEVLEDIVATKIKSDVQHTQESKLVLIAENGKDKLELDVNDLLYVESLENYVTVYFFKEGQVSKNILRSSLKRIADQIDDPSIERCHRSYMINLAHVNHFTGNAQGYLMSLENSALKVPVSRSYGPTILEKIKQLKSI